MYKTLFSLKNFRVFGDNGGDFDISPITILTGCNSSGKSSTIKALMLLNNYFKQLKSEFRNNQNLKIQNTELLFNKGKHNLGTYKKTISRYSKSNEMIFSWESYSPLFADNLTIEYIFRENQSNILNNAILSRINIRADGEDFISLNFDGKFSYKLNFLLLKERFFLFAKIINYYNSIIKVLGHDEEGIPYGFQNEEAMYDPKYEINKEAVDIMVYCRTELKKNGISDSLLEKFKNISTESEALFYLPILDWLKDVPKQEVNSVIWKKFAEFSVSDADNANDEKLDQGVTETLKEILEDFHKSEFESFSDFYIKIENKFLEECSMSERPKFMLGNIDLTFIDHIMNDLGSVDSYNYSAFNLVDWHFFKQTGSDLLGRTPHKLFKSFMNLIEFCSKDKEFSKSRIKGDAYPGTKNYVEYFDAKEITAAVEYLTSILKDIIFNPPSFIQNIEFVDAVRVNTQRIYTFTSQGTEFNEVLLNYLNTYPNEIETWGKKLKPYQLGTFMKKWVKEFKIADDIIFENTEEGLGVLIYLVNNKKKELLADQGYGISQLISILLRIELNIIKSEYPFTHPLLGGHKVNTVLKYKESTVSIEEPETNLHPQYQSKLALMFIDAYKTYNIRFILETHSEYLIRKFQTLIAKKEMDASDIAVHYIYNPNPKDRPVGKPQVQIIAINDDGKLNEPFGTGFFDEADNLALELLTLKSVN